MLSRRSNTPPLSEPSVDFNTAFETSTLVSRAGIAMIAFGVFGLSVGVYLIVAYWETNQYFVVGISLIFLSGVAALIGASLQDTDRKMMRTGGY